MSELRGLLSFMEAEDRDRAIRRYEAMFDAAGVQGEEALLSALGSPVKQAVAAERELREAQSRGEVPFAGGEASPPEAKEGGPSDLARMLRAAAAALEDESRAEETGGGEDVAPEALYDDDFPIEEYNFSGAAEGEPSGGDGPRPGETALKPAGPEDLSALYGGGAPAGPESLAEEPPGEGDNPLPAGDEPGGEPFPGEAPAPGEEPPDAPGEEPEDRESRRETPAEEPAAGKKKKAGRGDKSESPGPGRVLAAVAAAVPLLVLCGLFFVLFIALGALAVAVGFGLCVAGVYIAGYVFNGAVTFIPDLLLTAGGALLCLALAVLLMWTGLWVAAGGCIWSVRFFGGMYSRILGRPRTVAEEVEDVG